MKRIAFTLMAILIVAFPLFSQNGNIAHAAEIYSLDTYGQEFFSETFSEQDSILLDSVYHYRWDEAIYDWTSNCCFEIHPKTIYIYDENVNLILIVPYHWWSEINEWRECSVRGYTYDEKGNRILENFYHLDEDTNERIVSSKTEYTYDENGNQKISAHFTLDETTLEWNGYEKYEYGYDENGNKTFELEYHWDKATNDWIEYRKNESVYDGNNNMVLRTRDEWDETTNDWRETRKDKYEYTYDENGNILAMDLYHWGRDLNDWIVGGGKYEYAYDEDGNMILEIEIYWNHSTLEWYEVRKHEYVYDDNGNKTQEFHYNEGDLQEKREYTYDKNLIQVITFWRDEITKEWMADGKDEWYYSNHRQSTQISKYFQNAGLLIIYPNPTNSQFTIETDNPDHYSIEITSLNGQQILTGEMEGTTHQIDLSSFQKGVYFITVRSDDFVTTRKIIKY